MEDIKNDEDEPGKNLQRVCLEKDPIIWIEDMRYETKEKIEVNSMKFKSILDLIKNDCSRTLKLRGAEVQDIIEEFSKYLNTFALETSTG